MARLKIADKDISELIKDLKHPLENEEKRIKITCEDFKHYGESIIKDLKSYAAKFNGWSIEPNNYEGIKINCNEEEGWALLRVSLHEPLFVINIESDIEGGVKSIFSKLEAFMKNYSNLAL